jgi:hypothetical protein
MPRPPSRRTLRRALFCLSFAFAACAIGAPSASGEASLDDVTNGLAAAESAANPIAGAFYNDAGDGDIRARTENFFADGAGVARGQSAHDRMIAAAQDAAKNRMLIQRGEIRVEVPRPDDVAREYVAAVVAMGGYLHSQQGTTLVVRLPAQRFDEAFAAARALGRVLGESRQANDVTDEFVDLGIRIDTARKARDRLLEVLAKAEKVEDILKIEAELRRLTEEIERMEGRRKVLVDQVALATLQVQLFAVAPPPPPKKRARQPHQFHWIDRVGADLTLEGS